MSQSAPVSTESAITDRGPVNVIQDGIICTVIYPVQPVILEKIVNIFVIVKMGLNVTTSLESVYVLQVRLSCSNGVS